MADKNRLGILGCLFAGLTFGVALMAFVVVRGHVQGKIAFDDVAMAPQLVSISAQ